MTTDPRRAAIYARVSTTEQNVEMQTAELRELAGRREMTITAELVDHASGAKASRPALDELRELVRRGKVDTVLVWRLDRLGRSLRNFLDVAEELRENRVTLISAREGLDFSSTIGQTFAKLLALLGEMEREWIRERVTAGVANARRRGKRIGRRPKDIDMDHALELRAGGASVRQIAAELDVPKSIVARALAALPGGLCCVCREPMLVDLHGRARWHYALDAKPCHGIGHAVDPLDRPETVLPSPPSSG
jgi:DNA invertase Pin-like site-specific DNA recombinase